MSNKAEGFTLIEVLVTLVIVSVGMLSLGSFYVAAMSQATVAQERIAAVHMAEQLIEEWQKNNVLPAPDCTLANGNPAGALTLGTATQQCTANQGLPATFDILAKVVTAQAPSPVAPSPLMNMVDSVGNAIKARSVKVSWSHKGKLRFILLTHIRSAL